MKKKISVIVPVHNAKKSLKRCVESLLSQTYQNMEIILVDNGSSDGSDTLCDDLQKGDNRIVVYHEKKSGVSLARNIGLGKATGEYIGFCDADDYIEADMYSCLATLMEKENADLSMCNGWVEYASKKNLLFQKDFKEKYIEGKEGILTLHERSFFSAYVWNKLFCKELLEGVFFREDLDFAEDYDFFSRLLEKKPKIVCTSKAEYHYVQKKHQKEKKKNIEPIICAWKMFDMHRKKWCQMFPEEMSLFQCYYLYDVLGLMALLGDAKGRAHEEWKKMQSIIKKDICFYLRGKRVPFYMKICALTACMGAKLYAWEYQLVNWWKNR